MRTLSNDVVGWLNDNQGFADFTTGVLASVVALAAIFLSRRDARQANARAAQAEDRERTLGERMQRAQVGANLSIVSSRIPSRSRQAGSALALGFDIANIGPAAATNLRVWASSSSNEWIEPADDYSRRIHSIAAGRKVRVTFPVASGDMSGRYANLTVYATYDDPVGEFTQSYRTLPAA